MNKVGWIIFSVIVIGALGGLVAWAKISNPPVDVSGINNNSIIKASKDNGNIGDHVTGQTDGKIIFIEYGDFQCPSCGGAYPGVKSLITDYGNKVTFIFRNLPLTTIHPNAKAAAATAEAAGLQGKYWQMHDKLYENQNEWSELDASRRTDIFNGYATSLGLNLTTFNNDVAGSSVNDKISFDQAVFKTLGESVATPTFYLNGKKLDDTASNGIVRGDLTAIKQELDKLTK